MANRRVVVVGAGMAGLSAALRLHRAGAEVTVFESSDRVGGRTSSETHDGYLYERGTQFFTTTYRNALGLIKEMGLQAELRPTSPWITVFKDGRPYRMPSGLLSAVYALTSGLLRVRDLARFTWHTTSLRWPAIDNYSAWAEYDDEDAARWGAAHLGRGLDYLLEPVLAGGMMQRIEETSRACALAVLATTANGRSKELTLARGNDSLPRAMAARVEVKLEAAVQAVEATPDGVTVRLSGETVRADAVVIATTSSAAAGIYRGADRLERELMATPYGSVIKVGLATARDWSDNPGLSNVWAMMIPRSERRQIVSVTIESAKDPKRVPKGGEMLNLFVTPENAERMMDWPDEQVVSAVAADVERLFPAAFAAKRFARVVRWREGMPKWPVGRARALAEYRRTRPRDCRVWLAGDYMGVPTLESAIETGTWAADRIIGG
ncbi:MAG: NAD(P)/FAD-dependent oxidoreductase [Candidatus Binataceae bacterium]